MKFYFDGEKICTSKAHNYTHAIVYPAKPGTGKKWQLQSRHSSLANTRRGLNLYNPEKAAALRLVELEARP